MNPLSPSSPLQSYAAGCRQVAAQYLLLANQCRDTDPARARFYALRAADNLETAQAQESLCPTRPTSPTSPTRPTHPLTDTTTYAHD
jgi:hypothetical protein